MYIAYVYIEEFEGLKDVELCLSNRWVIRKESLENGKLTLSIKENPEFIEGFWNENPKSTTKLNVSAIVGRNGSGKTRILKLLALISTRSSKLSGAKIFSIFNSNNGLNLVGVSGHEMVVDWFCPSLGTYDYLNVAEIEDKFIFPSIEYFERKPPLQQLVFPVYYSPIFLPDDTFSLAQGRDGYLANVSISELIFHPQGTLKERIWYRDQEIKDQLTFLEEVSKVKQKEFTFPGDIQCIFYPFPEPKTRHRENEKVIFDKILTFFKKGYRGLWGELSHGETIFLDGGLIKVGFVLKLLCVMLEDLGSTMRFHVFKDCPMPSGEALDKYLATLWNHLEEWEFRGGIDRGWSKGVESISKRLDGTEGTKYDFAYSGDHHFFFNLSSESLKEINQALQSFRIPDLSEVGSHETDLNSMVINEFKYAPFVFLPINSLSSGQQLLLSSISKIVAGIRAVSQKSKFNFDPQDSLSDYPRHFFDDPNRKQILLMIDEGESSLHPQYQIEYVNDLFELLRPILPALVDLQIIFSTHSPLMLSDFPGYSVHRLFTEEDKAKMKEKGLDPLQKPRTFGANVHSLLKDDFFIDDTIGKFARAKLEWVVNRISGEVSWEDGDEEKADRIIKMLGEPVLKERLENYRKFQKARMDGKSVIDAIRREDRKSKTKDDGANQ